MEKQTIDTTKKSTPKKLKIFIISAVALIFIALLIFMIFFMQQDNITCVLYVKNNDFFSASEIQKFEEIRISGDQSKLTGAEKSRFTRYFSAINYPSYEFNGWYLDENFNTPYDYTKQDNIYARWDRIDYTLTYEYDSSYNFKDSESYMSLNIWHPNHLYAQKNEKVKSDKYFEADKEWNNIGSLTFSLENDKSTFILISPLNDANFIGWEVYDNLGNLKSTINVETRDGKSYCRLDKVLLSELSTDRNTNPGLVLKAVFNK